MSHKFLNGLNACRFCGGQHELRKEARHFRASSTKLDGVNFYIRCEKCHARTKVYKRMESLINAWSIGAVIRPVHNEKLGA